MRHHSTGLDISLQDSKVKTRDKYQVFDFKGIEDYYNNTYFQNS